MKPSCPRSFEVEAARDGRLTGSELARFQAHVEHCAACARHVAALDALGQSLRALPAITTDDLHVRRERTRLLADFDAALVPAPTGAKRRILPLLGAAALTVSALALWYSQKSSAPSAASRTLATPRREAIAIQAAPSTEWSRQVESHRETITLTDGTLSVAIDHALSPRRLRVVLPDGDLEDLGTTFSVTATRTATTRVIVQDGTVILRLRDRAPVILNANESWTPATPSAAEPARPPEPPAAPPARAAVPPSRAPTALRSSAGGLAAAPDASRDAAADFRVALAALNAGKSGLAASLFAAFLSRHPTAPNAEDAAYLRILALQRAGDSSAMRSAARDYLSRYPGAFRRAEVEPLSR